MRVLQVVLLYVFVASTAESQKRDRCGRDAIDTVAAGMRVYYECEVDRPAKLKSEPRLALGILPESRIPRCYSASLSFVVDTTGLPIESSVKPKSGNNQELERAMRSSLQSLRYFPGEIGGSPVPQYVTYKRTVATTVTVVSGGVAPPPEPPRC